MLETDCLYIIYFVFIFGINRLLAVVLLAGNLDIEVHCSVHLALGIYFFCYLVYILTDFSFNPKEIKRFMNRRKALSFLIRFTKQNLVMQFKVSFQGKGVQLNDLRNRSVQH